MRHALELEGRAQFRPLLDPRDDAAVVEAEELPQDEDSKQLGLGELVRALGVRIVREGFPSRRHSRTRQRDRVFGGFAHTSYIDHFPAKHEPFFSSFQQSNDVPLLPYYQRRELSSQAVQGPPAAAAGSLFRNVFDSGGCQCKVKMSYSQQNENVLSSCTGASDGRGERGPR